MGEERSPCVIGVTSSLEHWNKKGLVISPDLDGILSGVILASRYNAEIIGVYHTNFERECRLFRLGDSTNEELKSALWVDVDICSSEIQSIGQHIIHRDLNDTLSLRHPHSYNPHDTLSRSWRSEFSNKFPYSTSDLIIEGLEIETRPLSGLSTLRCLADSMYSTGSLMNRGGNNPVQWNLDYFAGSNYLSWINGEQFLVSSENLLELSRVQSTLIANGIVETNPIYSLGFINRIRGQAINPSIFSSRNGLRILINSISEIAGIQDVHVRGEVSGIAGSGQIYSHPRARSNQHHHERTADYNDFLTEINAFSYAFAYGNNSPANSHLPLTVSFVWND